MRIHEFGRESIRLVVGGRVSVAAPASGALVTTLALTPIDCLFDTIQLARAPLRLTHTPLPGPSITETEKEVGPMWKKRIFPPISYLV